MMGPQASRDEYGRLLLQHGPIDLIVEMYGDGVEVEKAYGQAQGFFQDVLDGLVGELAQLRRPVTAAYPMFQGKIAQRMARAVWPLRHDYITPMAAVAGAVAQIARIKICWTRAIGCAAADLRTRSRNRSLSVTGILEC